jgi:hypothetical protein
MGAEVGVSVQHDREPIAGVRGQTAHIFRQQGNPGRMPWRIEELQDRVEVEIDPAQMKSGEMAGLADVLRPHFEDPRFRSIMIRGLENQEFGPPHHVVQALTNWAAEYDTWLKLRPRL